MIQVEFYRNDDGIIRGYSFSGHSDYAEQGSDIVCAAVSSAAYMAANTISEILGEDIDTDVDDGYMKVIVPKPESAQDILRGLELHLKALAGQYPDDINFREV